MALIRSGKQNFAFVNDNAGYSLAFFSSFSPTSARPLAPILDTYALNPLNATSPHACAYSQYTHLAQQSNEVDDSNAGIHHQYAGTKHRSSKQSAPCLFCISDAATEVQRLSE